MVEHTNGKTRVVCSMEPRSSESYAQDYTETRRLCGDPVTTPKFLWGIQGLDTAIHWMNPLDNSMGFGSTYPMDRGLSQGPRRQF